MDVLIFNVFTLSFTFRISDYLGAHFSFRSGMANYEWSFQKRMDIIKIFILFSLTLNDTYCFLYQLFWTECCVKYEHEKQNEMQNMLSCSGTKNNAMISYLVCG